MVLEFTVSVVSALINAATIFGSASEGLSHIVLVAITFPLALGIVLVGLLNPDKDRTFKANAITLTVIASLLLSTIWPGLVGSDSASTKGLPGMVIFTAL